MYVYVFMNIGVTAIIIITTSIKTSRIYIEVLLLWDVHVDVVHNSNREIFISFSRLELYVFSNSLLCVMTPARYTLCLYMFSKEQEQ